MTLAGLSLADERQPIPLDHRGDDIHLYELCDISYATIGAQMYSERLIDHFQNPRNVGELPPPANNRGGQQSGLRRHPAIIGSARRARCNRSAVQDAGLYGLDRHRLGADRMDHGKTKQDLGGFRPAEVEEMVGGLSPESKHAAVLCADAVRALLRRF